MMSHTFHCHLSKSFRWYKNWHQHPHHQHTHWSIFVVIMLFVFSSMSGSINSTGQFYSEQNTAEAQTVNTLNFSGNTDLNISGWQQRINLQSVTFSGSQICLNSSDYGLLTGVNDSGGGLISSNVWIIASINGQWEAGTYEYFRPGTNGCADAASVNYYGYQGGAVRNTAFTSTRFIPQQGVVYGFMISGIARTGLGLEGTNENYISNIVTVPWTGSTGGGGTGQFDLGQPNNNFYQYLSNYTNAASSRNIYTLLAVYNMWLDDPGDGWNFNPFNPANNINSETDYINGPDMFVIELTKAMANDMSQNSAGRQFLRSVWQTMTIKLAQNTPNTALFQPLSEPDVNLGVPGFDKNIILTQMNQWWGKGKLVDNPAGRNDPVHPQAIYRDYHYNFAAESGANLMGADTIVNTDSRCDPPPDNEIIDSARTARDNNGNYLVYDCQAISNWQSRVIASINSALGGIQPSVTMGQGRLIGYGGPDFWINITTNGSYTNFLDQLKNAGANLTFALAIANPVLVSELPWIKSSGAPPPPPPPPPSPSSPPPTSRYLLFAAPDFAPAGTTIILSGQNLAATVEFFDSSRTVTMITGILDPSKTEVTVVLPSNLTPGNYTVRIADIPASNEIPFEVTPGMSGPGTTGTESPIITSINPLTIYLGGTIEIIGEFLDTDVQFTDINGQSSYATGIISEDNRVITVTIPTGLPAGIYTVSVINPNGITTALDILTVIETPNTIGPSAQSAEPPTTTSTFQGLIDNIFNYAIMLVGIAVFIMILWAGFLWLTSPANPGNIATAKGYISSAILGGILLLSAYVILYTINPELVGGEFNLKGITTPPSVPVQPPPGGGNVIPNTGCGTNQQFAQDLIDDLGISNFSISAGCGGNNNAQQNIIDMASGICPSVCADQCTPACTAGGPTGDITVDPEILEGLSALRTNRGIRFTVTSFTTGDHGLTSYHYAGRAVDIVVAQPNIGEWSETRLFLQRLGGSAICEIAGKVIPKCDDFSSGAHIHWQK